MSRHLEVTYGLWARMVAVDDKILEECYLDLTIYASNYMLSPDMQLLYRSWCKGILEVIELYE